MNAILRLRKETVLKDGSHPVELLVTLPGRERVRLGAGMSVHPDHWTVKGLIRRGAPDYENRNLRLQQLVSKANDILVKAKLAGRALGADDFRAEWSQPGGADCFLAFCHVELKRQARVDLLSYQTANLYKSVLNKLKKYTSGTVKFSAITRDWLEEFDAWHTKYLTKKPRSRKNGRSARTKALKTIRKFLIAARRRGVYKGASPFDGFKIPATPRSLVWLTREELERLIGIYKRGDYQEELRPFLFSCFTGLRMSDVLALRMEDCKGGVIRIQMRKMAERHPHDIEVPLSVPARFFLDAGGTPLIKATSQHLNRTLKEAIKAALIHKVVSFHTARHTFAVMFLESGGSVEVLKELLGHSTLATTMIYVHVSGERKQNQMAMMDGLVKL